MNRLLICKAALLGVTVLATACNSAPNGEGTMEQGGKSMDQSAEDIKARAKDAVNDINESADTAVQDAKKAAQEILNNDEHPTEGDEGGHAGH